MEVPRADLKAGLSVLAAFVKAGLAASNGEVRRAIPALRATQWPYPAAALLYTKVYRLDTF